MFLAIKGRFVNANNISNSNQYGFRTNMSTSHAVIELIEEISNIKDRKNHAIGVFIDLEKVFDAVIK